MAKAAKVKVGGLDLSGFDAVLEEAPKTNAAAYEISISEIEEDPNQPRKEFNAEKLTELADSIKARGVLQAITVRPRDGGKYQIVMGARRFRAAQIAGLSTIPTVIRAAASDAFDQMIENIQRDDLSHEDTARFIIAQLENGTKSAEIARLLGKQKSWVSRYKNFFTLHPMIRERVEGFGIQTAHTLQRGMEIDEPATIAFMVEHDEITRTQVEAFLASLQAPPEPAVSDSDSFVTPSSSSDAAFVTESTFDDEFDGGDNDYASTDEREKTKADKKPKYAAIVESKKRPGELGRILTDRLPEKGYGHIAVSFDGEIIEMAVKDVKLVGVNQFE